MEPETRTRERRKAVSTRTQRPVDQHLSTSAVSAADEFIVRTHRAADRQLVWVSLAAVLFIVGLFAPIRAGAVERPDDRVFGVRLRVGWKYDDVRMCGATGPGAPHGPDIDIAAFTELALWDDARIDVNLPIFRPIVLAFSAKMLQLEPEVTLLFRGGERGGRRFVAGPSVGVSLHYGPDYNSEPEGDGRTSSFWAIGPRVGGYVGVDFARPSEVFNFQLGLHPYVAPLISINDERGHRGWVVGVTVDNAFRFHADP